MKDKWKCKNPIICKFSKPPGHQKTLHYLTETSKKQIYKIKILKHQGSKRDDENLRSTTWKRKRNRLKYS